jgi:hypothetical protein
MPATDPQSLLAAANCFSCFGSNPGLTELMRLALLKDYLLELNPMAATDPQSLLTSANCYSCFGSTSGQQQLIGLALLRQILLALNPAAATDAQTLLQQSNCYSCNGNASMWQLMELALLAQIVNSPGTSNISTFVSTPQVINGAPTVYSANHGLAGTPEFVQVKLRCISNDVTTGLVAGQEVNVDEFFDSADQANAGTVYADATKVYYASFAVTNGGFGINIVNASSTAIVNPTIFTNFMLVFYALRY